MAVSAPEAFRPVNNMAPHKDATRAQHQLPAAPGAAPNVNLGPSDAAGGGEGGVLACAPTPVPAAGPPIAPAVNTTPGAGSALLASLDATSTSASLAASACTGAALAGTDAGTPAPGGDAAAGAAAAAAAAAAAPVGATAAAAAVEGAAGAKALARPGACPCALACAGASCVDCMRRLKRSDSRWKSCWGTEAGSLLWAAAGAPAQDSSRSGGGGC